MGRPSLPELSVTTGSRRISNAPCDRPDLMIIEKTQPDCRRRPGKRLKKRSFLFKNPNHNKKRKKDLEPSMRSTEHLRELCARLLSAQEEERRRIAHEVHENLAQAMIAIQLRVETALNEMTGNGDTKALELLEPVAAILQEGIGSIRMITGRLRPSVLDDLGILPAVSRLFKDVMSNHPGLSIEASLEVEERDIPEALKMVIYRILESAVCSILKKNPNGLVAISLLQEGPLITLAIRNSGEGLVSEEILPGCEIQEWSAPATIGERAMLSGGALTVASLEGDGTTMQISWSLEEGTNPVAG